MKHVALVIPTLDRIGGAERQLLLLAHCLGRRGWKTSIVALTGEATRLRADLADAGIDYCNLGMRKGVADPRGWVRFYRWLKRARPDLLHAHLPHASWLARWSRLAWPQTVVIDTLHSSATGNWRRRLGYRASNWLSDKVTAVSQAVADAHSLAEAIPEEKLIVLPNGIDRLEEPANPAIRVSLRESLGVGEHFLWIASGRLEAVKDYPTLLRAFARLDGGSHLMIIGAGSQRAALEQLCAELRVAQRVHFLGFVDDPRPLLVAGDAVVLSSLWEGLPMSLLEAGASALPAVATDVPGSREAIEKGKTGDLVPAREPEALANAMRRLEQCSAEERKRLGRNARLRIETFFGIEPVLERWEETYAACLQQRVSPPSRCPSSTGRLPQRTMP